jgi:bifunctional non-homologous end joining protein LigD
MNPGGWRRSRARGERINIGAATACLYAFDLLHVGRDDLRRYELVERRALLRKYTAKAGPALLYSDHMEGDEGEAMFRHACRLGLEGIVSKRATSRYKSGRCDAWRKIKNPAYERR